MSFIISVYTHNCEFSSGQSNFYCLRTSKVFWVQRSLYLYNLTVVCYHVSKRGCCSASSKQNASIASHSKGLSRSSTKQQARGLRFIFLLQFVCCCLLYLLHLQMHKIKKYTYYIPVQQTVYMIFVDNFPYTCLLSHQNIFSFRTLYYHKYLT